MAQTFETYFAKEPQSINEVTAAQLKGNPTAIQQFANMITSSPAGKVITAGTPKGSPLSYTLKPLPGKKVDIASLTRFIDALATGTSRDPIGDASRLNLSGFSVINPAASA